MDLKEARAAEDVGACRHPWELARLDFLCRLFRRNAPVCGLKPVRVLDIGCGDGFLSRGLMARFPSVHVLGVDTALSPEAQARLQTIALEGRFQAFRSMDDVPGDESGVGVVLLMDVLEHVDDDQAFLRRLNADPRLAPDATLMVTAPAFGWLYSAHDALLEHKRRYSLSRLRSLAETSFFRVVDAGYIFTSLLAPRFVARVAQAAGLVRTPRQTGLAKWRCGAAVTQFLRLALGLDVAFTSSARRLGLVLPGLSCYMVCQKQA